MSAESASVRSEFQDRLAFETMLADLSSMFVNLPPTGVDPAIEEALRRVCESIGIDWAVLWQWSSDDPGVIRPTHFFPSEEGLQASEPLDQSQYPWVVQPVSYTHLTLPTN